MKKTVSNYYIRQHLDGTFSVDIEWGYKRPWRLAKYELEVWSANHSSIKEAQESIDRHVISMKGPKTVKSSWQRGPDGTANYYL